MKCIQKMKKLYIIRHAKSSWRDESVDDFDRPLNKRGKANAPFLGSKFKNRDVIPDMILSSPALRAMTTTQMMAKEMKYHKEIVYDKDIYESSVDTLKKILAKVDDSCSVLFLVGHNPSLNMLAAEYVSFHENIPTCGVVEIDFECDKWADISAKNAKLVLFDYPKKHL